MSPWQQLEKLYELHPSRNLYDDYRDCVLNGYVIRTERCIMLGYAVDNCGWYVLAAAGDIRDMLAHIPHALPWIGFSRHNTTETFKWYDAKKLTNKIMGGAKLGTPAPVPPPPTKAEAALDVNAMGTPKKPVGFTQTILGDNSAMSGNKKTILGG